MSERVTISVENHIADVRFNRPDKMNALDPAQIDAIEEAGRKLAEIDGVRAIVLSGEGRAEYDPLVANDSPEKTSLSSGPTRLQRAAK